MATVIILLIQIFLIIQNKKAMATQEEITQALTDLTATVAKIGDETKATLQKVADLETALAGQASVSPELQAAFDALKDQVGIVDALVPDAA